MENNWRESTTKIWGESVAATSPSSPVGRKNGSVSSDLVTGFENYVFAEMKCAEFLCKRHSLMIEKSVHLQREIVEYTNLGMKVRALAWRFMMFCVAALQLTSAIFHLLWRTCVDIDGFLI